MDYTALALQIKTWAKELGFADVGITGVALPDAERNLQKWLDAGYHGEMDYMANHGMLRARPAELVPGTLRVISVRMDYLPEQADFATNMADHFGLFIYTIKFMGQRILINFFGGFCIFFFTFSDSRSNHEK